MSKLTQSPQWKALEAHHKKVGKQHLRDLFAADASRFETFSLEACGLLLDYSKNRITCETLDLLLDLARVADVEGWRMRMFAGEKINTTENCAALHVALRNRANTPTQVDGVDIMADINDVLARMDRFAEAVRDGSWLGATGEPITDVVNIGIGGSDLGPNMVIEALPGYVAEGLKFHFVSNVDGAHIASTLSGLSWQTTLFVICSKSFTTEETMLNANTARSWFMEQGGAPEDIARHFAAATANTPQAEAFGIPEQNIFTFWDWVGGRFSLWSSVGLAIVIALGGNGFKRLLTGAHAMDRHFTDAPLERNMPVILALLRIWYTNFFAAQSHLVIPYCQNLHLFPDYLQQGDMESNGKNTDRGGNKVDYATAPVTWGKAGTDSQHSFFQRLHQGTGLVPADFLVAVRSDTPLVEHHDNLLANFIAQSEALMVGKTEAQVREELQAKGMAPEALEALLPHMVSPGNQPTNSIVFSQLDPETLGSLIALYEHVIFVQGVVWNINSFDQWGVELGKQLSGRILHELRAEQSDNGLIRHIQKLRS